MKLCFSFAAVVASLTFGASAVNADILNPTQWTLGNFADGYASPTAAVGTIIPILSPFAVFGSGTVTTTLMTVTGGNAGKKGVTTLAATAVTSGTVSSQWTYQAFDMACYDNGGYFINGQFKVIACNQSGPFSGLGSFSVNAGDTFGFGVRTGDGLESSGTLKVLSFQFSGVLGPAVVGDLDGNGVVSGADLAILLGAWGQTSGAADLDGNGIVDAADLAILLGNWG